MISNYRSKENNILSFNLNSSQKIILIKLSNIKSTLENERSGANFYDYLKKNSIFISTFLEKNILQDNKKK